MWDDLTGIGERQDRSATFALIDALADPGIAEPLRERITATLGRLADPRAVEPLTGIGLDRTRPVDVRRAALAVLEDTAMCPEGEALRRWWHIGDETVRACVLRQAERGEADLLAPIVGDRNHPLHRHALTGIAFGFEEPHWQEAKIRGLEHPDPAIRTTAAEVLRWDEPVAATPALHRAAIDHDTEVAVTAVDTLRYYRTRATLRLLDDIGRGGGETAATARSSARELRYHPRVRGAGDLRGAYGARRPGRPADRAGPLGP